MGGLSIVHWAVVVIAAMLLFGGGRVAATLGELGHGVRALRKGLADEEPLNRLPPPPTE